MATFCDLCDHFQADNVQELAEHQGVQHAELPGVYWCPRCKLGYPNKDSFSDHAYQCQGHQWVAIRSFDELEEAHQQYRREGSSSERRDSDHYCNFCGTKSENYQSLRDHQYDLHRDKIKYKCKYGRGFENKDDLKEHRQARICGKWREIWF